VSYFVDQDGLMVYDATSGFGGNYFVDHLSGDVYVADFYWQNQHVLFGQHEGTIGIAYDQYDNSLWLSEPATDIIAEYSLSGRLLRDFHTGSAGNSALAFDPADGSLWMMTGGRLSGYLPDECLYGFPGACLEQWSTDGRLLQVGTLPSFPAWGFAPGEIAEPTVPDPGTILLFGSGFLGVCYKLLSYKKERAVHSLKS